MANVRDWTRYIVPRINENTLANGRSGGVDFLTTDLVSLPTYDEIRNQTNAARSVTDFALMNNTEHISNAEERPDDFTPQGKLVGRYQSRTAGTIDNVLCLHRNNSIGWVPVDLPVGGLCPHLTLRLPDGVTTIADITREIGPVREVKFKDGESYYTIDLGAYPKTRVGDDFAAKLESMYHGGRLRGGLAGTGRLFTTNGQRDFRGDFLSKQNPEFSYQGKQYVRVVVQNQPTNLDNRYQDGTPVPEEGIQWAAVEPITFRINNTQELLNGEARGLDLECEELLVGGLPFYPNPDHAYPTMWQNSLLRAFLNSADSRELDGHPDYRSTLQWDFRESGFLHQALDLTREPTRVYTIPATESRIADYALAGCVGIQKIIIPEHVTEIDQHAFDGCVNTQLWIRPNRNLVLDQDALAGTDFQFTYVAKRGHEVILSPYEDATLDAAYIKKQYRHHKLGTLNLHPTSAALKGDSNTQNPAQKPGREL